MNLPEIILSWVSAIIIAYIAIVTLLGLIAILTKRDQEYRRKRLEYEEQERRVQERLRRDGE